MKPSDQPVPRWPVHPAPVPGEAASSWLARLANAMHIDAGILLDDVGYHLDTMIDIDDLDIAVPTWLAHRLSARTGVPTHQIRRMGLTGYHPWLIGTPSAPNQYAAYTQRHSILQPPGTRHRQLRGWLAWLPTDQMMSEQSCPSCLPANAAPPSPYLLAWTIPIMLTCPIHRCWLGPAADPATPAHDGPPDPAVITMDSYTWQALTIGHATLPGGTVPARTWFRLLRTIIDEITVPPADSGHVPATFQPDHPSDEWHPYETLDCVTQEETLEATAAVIASLRDGIITGHGTAAHLFQPPRDPPPQGLAQPTSDDFAAHS